MSLKKTQLKLRELHHGKIFYCADLYTNDVAKIKLTSSLKYPHAASPYFEAVIQTEDGIPYKSEFYAKTLETSEKDIRRIFSKKKQAEEYLVFGATDPEISFKLGQLLDASSWWPDDEEYLVDWED